MKTCKKGMAFEFWEADSVDEACVIAKTYNEIDMAVDPAGCSGGRFVYIYKKIACYV